MWKEYFGNAVIYGLDHFEGNQGNGTHFEGFRKYYDEVIRNPEPRIQLIRVDQSKPSDLEQFVSTQQAGTFDVIMDDGSHLMHDQQLTFGMLWTLLRPGGYFVIEDVHTSFENGYDVEPKGVNTTYSMLKTFQSTHQLKSKYVDTAVLDRIAQEIESVAIYEIKPGSMTSIIHKKLMT